MRRSTQSTACVVSPRSLSSLLRATVAGWYSPIEQYPVASDAKMMYDLPHAREWGDKLKPTVVNTFKTLTFLDHLRDMTDDQVYEIARRSYKVRQKFSLSFLTSCIQNILAGTKMSDKGALSDGALAWIRRFQGGLDCHVTLLDNGDVLCGEGSKWSNITSGEFQHIHVKAKGHLFMLTDRKPVVDWALYHLYKFSHV